MQFVAVALVAMQAIGQIKQGRQEQNLYQMQAVQARDQARVEAVKFEQQGNSILRRSLETQAAARARAAAGGIDPFSGSAQFIQDLSAAEGMADFDMSQDNAKLAALGGIRQAGLYEEAGRTARRRGLLAGIGTAGMGAVNFGKIGGPSGGGSGALDQYELHSGRGMTDPRYG